MGATVDPEGSAVRINNTRLTIRTADRQAGSTVATRFPISNLQTQFPDPDPNTQHPDPNLILHAFVSVHFKKFVPHP